VIYLTETRTACTETLSLLNDIAYPQQVHWFPETYSRIKTGMSYVPHKMAEKVLDATVLKTLRDNPVKTAFILAAGNAHFAGIAPKAPDNQLDYDYKFMPLALTQVYAGRIAQSCGATDSITTDSTACASSLKVMMDVQSLIKFYGFERVVVLTLEDLQRCHTYPCSRAPSPKLNRALRLDVLRPVRSDNDVRRERENRRRARKALRHRNVDHRRRGRVAHDDPVAVGVACRDGRSGTQEHCVAACRKADEGKRVNARDRQCCYVH